MSKTLKLLVLSLSFLALTAMGLGQGSGTTTAPATSGPDPYRVTHSVTGIVEELDQEGGTLIVVDEKSGQRWGFETGEETRFVADKAVFGKKKIAWADLQVGQRIRVTFRAASQGPALNFGRDVLEIKVRKPKKS